MDTRMQDNPPGATSSDDGSDNHLRLNPSQAEWKDAVESWEDGQTYVFEQVKVRQVSPGEYQVLSAVPEGAEPSGSEGERRETAEPEEPAQGDLSPEQEANPTMRRLMASQKG